jgi:outer membrane protein assembly factor BamE (lipoprotein component of BamABCDE complex)
MTPIVIAIVAALTIQSQGPVTIDPGMSREQVVAKLGEPMSARSYDGHTYLLYRNGCEKKCGMNDLVVLDSGKVVDAVFRSSGRKYSGTSSSPHMISAAEARKGAPAPSSSEPLKTPPKKPGT